FSGDPRRGAFPTAAKNNRPQLDGVLHRCYRGSPSVQPGTLSGATRRCLLNELVPVSLSFRADAECPLSASRLRRGRLDPCAVRYHGRDLVWRLSSKG